MLTPPFTFEDIMAPLGAERFFTDYEGRQPLHLKGAADKFAEVMTYAKLSELLSQATIWSHSSLNLILDKQIIQPAGFCSPAQGRDGGQVLRPEPAKVKDYLRQGATLVANDIDHLSAGLTQFSATLEAALEGKVQANLYLSSKRRQGFAAHFDTHDVYAVHVEGTKTWHLYEGRATDPIAHPMFKTLPREHHEQAKGKLLMDITMAPGDLLYVPRGLYHDAIADDGGAVHIAFGVTYPIGIDVLTYLFERVVAEPAFRANLPRAGGPGSEQALRERLALLGDRLAALLAEPKTQSQIEGLQQSFHYPRDHYDLAALLAQPATSAFRVKRAGIRMVEQGGRAGLVRAGERNAVEVPAAVKPMVAWVLARDRFQQSELAEAFPAQSNVQRDKLLQDLAAMQLLAQE